VALQPTVARHSPHRCAVQYAGGQRRLNAGPLGGTSSRTMTYDEMLDDLYELVSACGALPDTPTEAEEYFSSFVAPFSDRESCREALQAALPRLFRTFAGLPEWIQEADWPWRTGRPMIFVGSIDAPPGVFHDDARFFLFWSPECGDTHCVIQVG
jgi:hypothetical protein